MVNSRLEAIRRRLDDVTPGSVIANTSVIDRATDFISNAPSDIAYLLELHGRTVERVEKLLSIIDVFEGEV